MNTSDTWYLKKPDGTVYGPVPLSELKEWAMNGRVAPEDVVSPDQSDWQPASALQALDMVCVITYEDGDSYGPVHPRALIELMMDEAIALTELVKNLTTGKELPAVLQLLESTLALVEPSAPDDMMPAEVEALKAQVAELEQGKSDAGQETYEARQALQKAMANHAMETEQLRTKFEAAENELKGRLTEAMTDARTAMEAPKADEIIVERDALKQELEAEQERSRKKEANLQRRIDELEREQRAKVEELVRLKAEVEELRKAQATVEGGGASPVVRAALSQQRARALGHAAAQVPRPVISRASTIKPPPKTLLKNRPPPKR